METETRMEADCQLEFREFFHAMRWYAWRRGRLYFVLVLFLLLLFVPFVFHPHEPPRSRFQVAFSPFSVVPVFAGGLFCGFFYWEIYRSARRQFKTSSALREARRYSFTEEGVESVSPAASAKFSWALLHRTLETPESFMLFPSDVVFIVIPKRILKSEERVEALRELIRKHLGAKARLRKAIA